MTTAADIASLQRSSGSVFDGWKLPVLDLAEFRSSDPASGRTLGVAQARYLLGFSLLAPSTHNTVPQAYRLALEDDRIELWLRRRHVLPESDPKGQEALVSLGCAVENLALAAAQYGVGCKWEVSPDFSWSDAGPSTTAPDVYVGSVLLSAAPVPSESRRSESLRGLLERRSVRAEYDATQRLPTELRNGLLASAGPSVRLLLFESTADKFAWGKLDELAMKHKLEEAAFRRELGEWLLPNEDDQRPRGMRGREFGFDDPLTRELSARLRGEIPMPVDQLAFIARAGRVGLCSATAVCVLCCLDASPATAICSGRTFQRCVLLAGSHGFACAMHTGVCHVPHARSMAQATLTTSLTPGLIFRLGKPLHARDGTRPHSARPQLEDLMISTEMT